MKKILYVLLFILCPVVSQAQDLKTKADSAYQQDHFAQAAELYEQLLQKGHSSEVYYNLGNCYYRLEKIAPCILNYERALLLSPGDAQVRHNLELARNKTIDKMIPAGEVFLVTWFKTIVNTLSVDGWGKLATVCFILALVMLGIYLFIKDMLWRKIGFYASIAFITVCVLANIFAWYQKQMLLNRNTAVVMTKECKGKTTPSDSGKDAFVIHEGTKVTVKDASMNEWLEVRLADGKSGWLRAENVEKI